MRTTPDRKLSEQTRNLAPVKVVGTGARATVQAAASIGDQWLEQSNVRLLAQGEGHWGILREMMIDGQASGPLATDAQLAALTIEYDGPLHTTDRDFAPSGTALAQASGLIRNHQLARQNRPRTWQQSESRAKTQCHQRDHIHTQLQNISCMAPRQRLPENHQYRL